MAREALTFERVEAVREAEHGLLEGPCVVGDTVVFSDVIAGGVFRLGQDGAVTEVLPRRRGIGGIVATDDGGLIVTGRDLTLVAPDGRTSTLNADPTAAGFNDIGVCRDGSVVAGVLRYRVLAGEEPQPGELLRIGPDGATSVVADDILWANGIAERSDGSLLVSDYARGHVKIVTPGGGASVFHDLPEGSPDGVALDAEGCLWVATGPAATLLRLDPEGRPLGEFDVPAGFVSSVCFAGPDLTTIVVTTIGSLLRARAPVAGAPLPLARVRATLEA